MCASERNLALIIKRSIGFSAFPALWTCGVAAVVLLSAAALRAQTPAPAAGEGMDETQEDNRAVRTREFLGLGRMPDAKTEDDLIRMRNIYEALKHQDNAARVLRNRVQIGVD